MKKAQAGCLTAALVAGAALAADTGGRQMVWAHYVPWFTPNNVSLLPQDFFNFPMDDAGPEPFVNEIRRTSAMGVDGFFVDMIATAGETTYWDLRPYLKAAEGTDFQFAICVDGTSVCDHQASELIRKLQTYGDHPNYAKVGGRYVVGTYVFIGRGADDWRQIRTTCEQAGFPLFLVANVERGLHQPVDETFLNPFADTFECAYFFAHTGYAGVSSAQEGRNVQAFGEKHGADFMPCLYPGYFGNWTAGGNDYYQPFRGIDRLHESFEEAMAFRDKVPWLHITSWNDHSETALQPCRLTLGTEQLIRAYSAAWKGQPPTERADVLFAYHREELPGTLLRIEALRLPASESGPVDVGCVMRDITGADVQTLSPQTLTGDWSRVEWAVGTEALAVSPCLTPMVRISRGEVSETRRLPPLFFKTPWLENPTTVRVAASGRRDVPSILSVDWTNDVLTAELTFTSSVAVARAVLVHNDRPIGQFELTDEPHLNLSFNCHHTGGVRTGNGRLLAAVKSNEADLAEGEQARFVCGETGCESVMTPTWKSFSATFAGAADMRITYRTAGVDVLSFTPDELLRARIFPTDEGTVRASPDLTLFNRPQLMRTEGTYRTRVYALAPTARDLYWVEFLFSDGTRGESCIVWPERTSAPDVAIVATSTTLETKSGSTGRTDRSEWLRPVTPFASRTVVPVAVPAHHRLHYDFEDNGLEAVEGRNVTVPSALFGEGHVGRGLVFSGKAEEAVNLPRRVTVMGSGQVDFWIRPEAPDGKKRRVLGKNGWSEGLDVSVLADGRLEAVWSAGETETVSRTVVSVEPLAPGSWSHVAVQLGPSSMALVVNGMSVSATDMPGIRCYGNLTQVLGASGGLEAFRGGLDEFSIGTKTLARRGHDLSVESRADGTGRTYAITVSSGTGEGGVYALYGDHEPDETEMWQNVVWLGEAGSAGGTYDFTLQGHWAAVRFAVGRLYVRDGLIAFWDGIWNQRAGHREKSFETWRWENLVSGGADFLMKPGEGEWPLVSDRSMDFGTKTGYGVLSADDTAVTFGAVSTAGGTMELSLSINPSFTDWSQVILRSSRTSNVAFGLDYRGLTPQGNVPTGTMTMNCKGENLKNAATVALAYAAGAKLPSAGYCNGSPLTLGGVANGVGASGFGEGETVIGRLRTDSVSEDNRQSYHGGLHAIRLYARALSPEEVANNSAVDKLRFLGEAETLTVTKEGVVETMTPVFRQEPALRVTGNPPIPRKRYASYSVEAGEGSVASELWLFSGRTAPANGLDFDVWEHGEKIADVPTAGGRWTISAPGDAVWRSSGYAVRFALIGKYVATGLVGRWDGITNTRRGHAASLTSLENLVGSSPDFTLNGPIGVTSSSLSFSGQAGCYAYMTATDFRGLAPYVEDTYLTLEATFRMRPGVNDGISQAIFNGTGSWEGADLDRIPYALCSLSNGRGLCFSTDSETGKGATCPTVEREDLQRLSTLAVDYRRVYGSFWGGTAHLNGTVLAREGTESNTAGGNLVTIGARKYGNTVADQLSFAGDFHSLRIYLRRLTAAETAHNAALDRIRFAGALSTRAGDTVLAASDVIRAEAAVSGTLVIIQ